MVARAAWFDMLGATLYTTDPPCDGCFRTIQGTPIQHIVAPGYEWNRRSTTP